MPPTGTLAPPDHAPAQSAMSAASRWGLDGRPSERMLVLALVVVAAAIRWADLWSIPIFTDEGDETGLALRIVRDGARPLTNDDPYLGPLFNYLLAGLFWLVGPSPWLPRLLMLGLGTLTVALAYLLARELTLSVGGTRRQGMAGGAVAAALLAVNPTHVTVVSHVAWGNCLTPCLTTAAAWLFVGAARRASMGRSGGRWLVPAAGALGLAFQTHPMVAAFLPAVGIFVLWRARGWLLTPWPYLAAGAFVLAQLPTLLFIGRNGFGRWLAAIHEKQTLYEGDTSLSGSIVVDRLAGLLHTLGAVVGGLLNDRDTPLAPPWHPAVVVALVVTVVALAWLWRRGQPLVPLMVLGNVALLPLVTGKYAPLINGGRYLMPGAILVMAGIGCWVGCSSDIFHARAARSGPPRPTMGPLHPHGPPAPSPASGRGGAGRWVGMLPSIISAVLGLVAIVSLVNFSRAAHAEGRTNDQLLASFGALEATYRSGDVVTIDRAMYRDWTLTEGRLQRVFESWLELRGIPTRVVDVEDGGRLRQDLAERGGLVVLARRTVPLVARSFQVEEIAGDAAPGATAGTGYSIVRIRPAGRP